MMPVLMMLMLMVLSVVVSLGMVMGLLLHGSVHVGLNRHFALGISRSNFVSMMMMLTLMVVADGSSG